LVTTTTPILKERLEIYSNKVVICPNAVSLERYRERPHQNKKIRVGWSGSVTHYEDLMIVVDVLKQLQKEFDIEVYLQGICSQPIDGEMYIYSVTLPYAQSEEEKIFLQQGLKFFKSLDGLNYTHIPFYPPELHAQVLRQMDLDIGICPLVGNYFNKAKSAMKFYQYAAVGTVTLASNIPPYKGEVNYTAKNNFKDWYKKLKRLITDEKFRQKTLKEQQKFVFENREISKVVSNTWEKYLSQLI